MPFPVHPQVVITEQSDGLTVPAISVNNAATVIQAVWGPAEEISIVASESDLANRFGKPNNTTYKDFLVAASFLAYGASNLYVVRVVDTATAKNASAGVAASGTGVLIKNADAYSVMDFSSSTNLWVARYPGNLGNSLIVSWADTTGFNEVDSNGDHVWPHHDLFNVAPATNEYHIVVADNDGLITGVAGTILETYAFASSIQATVSYDGTPAYFKSKINSGSSWILVGKASLLTGTNPGVSLAGGLDGTAVTDGQRETGFDFFADKHVDVSILMQGAGSTVVGQYVLDTIAGVRKDVVACLSPAQTDVVNVSDTATLLANLKTTRLAFGQSSYGFMESAYKLVYDRYNDVNRWIPLNGDIAGLMASTDDPWLSPAGYDTGKIKNVIKLTKVPDEILDELYSNAINAVVNDKDSGPVLIGDKTLLTRPDLFGYVGVRRLFIVVEKEIGDASKFLLFKPNDDFSRSQFVNLVTPFLRDVQGRRGLQKFKVVCDRTNNPDDIVAEGKLVGQITIQPTVSIQYVILNFVATKTGIEFQEVATV